MKTFYKSFLKHAKALRKEVSTVAVMKDGKMLMGKRRDNQKFTAPGGHLEPGEEPIDGAIRELFEESGVVATADDLEFIDTITNPDNGYVVHGYRLDLDKHPGTTMKNDPDNEVYRWHFMDTKKIQDDDLHVPRTSGNVLLPEMEKEASKDILPGGKSDHKPDSDFDKKEITKGMKVESEHTKNKEIQKEIAKDHLTEIPDYYERLAKMEKDAAQKKSKESAPAPSHENKSFISFAKNIFGKYLEEGLSKGNKNSNSNGVGKNKAKTKSKKSTGPKPEVIQKGFQHEIQSVPSELLAREIAMENLKNNPNHYDHVGDIEKSAFLKGFARKAALGASIAASATHGVHADEIAKHLKNPAAKAAYSASKATAKNMYSKAKALKDGASMAMEGGGSASGSSAANSTIAKKNLYDHIKDADHYTQDKGVKIRPNKINLNYKDLGVEHSHGKTTFSGKLSDNTSVKVDPKNKGVALAFNTSF